MSGEGDAEGTDTPHTHTQPGHGQREIHYFLPLSPEKPETRSVHGLSASIFLTKANDKSLRLSSLCSAPFPRSTKERRCPLSSGSPFAARSGEPGRDGQTNRRTSRPASSREARPADRRPGAGSRRGRGKRSPGPGRARWGRRSAEPAGAAAGGRAAGTAPAPGWGRGAAARLQEEGRLAASCPLHLSHSHTSAILSACGAPVCVSPPGRPRPVPSGRGLRRGAAPGPGAGPCRWRGGRPGRAGGGERRAAGSPGRSWQRGDAAARQGPAGEGACAAQVWRGVKIAPARLPLSSPPPSPAGGSGGQRAARRGGRRGRTGAGARQNPGPGRRAVRARLSLRL
ncbi:uncharacterized protein LJ206_001104 [Theristicus caerulescens]